MNESILSPNYFARLSAKLQALLLGIVTCGRELCYWLHRQAREFLDKQSNTVEINLRGFTEYSALGRAREYCIRHVRRNFGLLEARGFITILKRYNADEFRIQVHDPDAIADIATREEKIPVTYKKAQVSTERSRSQPSNPDYTVASIRPFKEAADNAMDEQVNAASQTSLDANKRDVLEQIRNLGVELNPAIQRLVQQASIETLIHAVAAVRQRLGAGVQVHNLGGYVTKAINQGWYPNKKGDRPSDRPNSAGAEKSPPPGFADWMFQARRTGIASDWRWENDEIFVQNAKGNWESWEELSVLFSLKRLTGMPSHSG